MWWSLKEKRRSAVTTLGEVETVTDLVGEFAGIGMTFWTRQTPGRGKDGLTVAIFCNNNND